MGREQRIKSTTGTAKVGVQSTGRFFLVGAPGTGKQKISESLAERFDEKLFFREDFQTRYALGSLADYRTELVLALDRWEREQTYDPMIYTHSLIDNLAYITYAISRYQLGNVAIGTAERAVLTMTILGTILTDSFKYDEIFFLEGDFDPNKDYDQYQIQTILQMILDEYQMSYHIIPADEDAEDKIADVLKGYLG